MFIISFPLLNCAVSIKRNITSVVYCHNLDTFNTLGGHTKIDRKMVVYGSNCVRICGTENQGAINVKMYVQCNEKQNRFINKLL